MWPETPTPVCVTGGFCTAQNSLGTPVIKTCFSQILSVKSISSHYFLGCILMRELSPAGYHERQHRVKRLLCVRRECCPQQLASPSPGSVVPHTPDSVGCSASLWLCSLCRLPWEMAQGSQLDQESILCLSQLHHPSAGSHPSLQDRGALQQPPLSAPMC